MTLIEFLHGEFTRVHTMFGAALSGLTTEQLHAVPAGHPTANTIAWGIWHYVRTEDSIVRPLLQDRRPPVWQEDGYAEKLGLPPETQGTGMSTEEAHALRITDVELFHDYMAKTWASTDELFAAQSSAFFEKVVTVKGLGEMSAIQVLSRLGVSHGLRHLGEIDLARTLVGAEPIQPI
jgi:DinB superfamily